MGLSFSPVQGAPLPLPPGYPPPAGQPGPVHVELSSEDLNVVHDLALAFGPTRGRPLKDRTIEQLPGRSAEFYDAIVAEIKYCVYDVESHIDKEYERLGGDWTHEAGEETYAWMIERYPWMNDKNRAHAFSQARYFAWRG